MLKCESRIEWNYTIDIYHISVKQVSIELKMQYLKVFCEVKLIFI